MTFIRDNLANTPPIQASCKNANQLSPSLCQKGARLPHSARSAASMVVLSRCDFARKHIYPDVDARTTSRIIFDTVDLHYPREDCGAVDETSSAFRSGEDSS